MRNLILVAFLVALAMVVGCQPKESKPTESTMNSMDTKTMEQPMENMQQSPEAMEEPAAATPAPEGGDGSGTTQ